MATMLALSGGCVAPSKSADPQGGSGGAGFGFGGAGGAASSASTSSGPGGSGGQPVAEDGSWEHPFSIAIPSTVEGDTRDSTTSAAHAYWPCAPSTNEGGAEIVYRVTVAEDGWLWARIDDVGGDLIDLDVHLLRAPDPDTCITRADVELGAPVAPGDHWIVVDTWVNGSDVALSGSYQLEVGLTTSAGDDCYLSPIACDGVLPPYANGVPVEAAGDAGCLPGMAHVDDFCVDRYEAMLAEVLPDDTLAPWSPYTSPGAADVMALSVAGVVPQGFITQVQAGDACARAGKRLCLDDEWLRACSLGTTYPYGDTREPGVCNDARDCHPVIQYFESDEAWVWSQLDHPCISQLPEGLARTGTHAGCTSGEGVFDMMGNLHEWTADPAGTFRGGFYVDTAINGPGCQYRTTAHNVQHWDYSTGFRCCADLQ